MNEIVDKPVRQGFETSPAGSEPIVRTIKICAKGEVRKWLFNLHRTY